MKKILVFISIFLALLVSTLAVSASVSLKITDTDLDCDESYINGGFDSCDLDVDVRIDSYYPYGGKEYDYFDRLTYVVECNADIDYTTYNKSSGSTFTQWSRVNEREYLYGIGGLSKTITLDIDFWSYDPVIQVTPSNLSCRITNIY